MFEVQTNKVGIYYVNEVKMKVVTSDELLRNTLYNAFSYYVENSHHMKRQSAYKGWDGKIHLFKSNTGNTYLALLPLIIDIIEKEFKHLHIVYSEEMLKFFDTFNYDNDEVVNFIENFAKGSERKPRDYQIDAVKTALFRRRLVVESPTASGKSLIMYLIADYLLKIKKIKSVLILVPTTNLVEQMRKDFSEYSNGETDAWVQMIYGGKDKEIENRIVISTWQSVYEFKKDYFGYFECLMIDEAHTAQAKCLNHIGESTINAKYRIGFTGTLQKQMSQVMQITAILGRPVRVAKTKELIEKNFLSNLRIETQYLLYDKVICEDFYKKCKKDYHAEVDYINSIVPRRKFITELTKGLVGNTLLLFTRVEKSGLIIYEELKKVMPDREIHMIYGDISVGIREDIRDLMKTRNDIILVASYGTTSAGVNIPSIKNIVMIEPIKSKIRLFQSIGRGLRLHEGKDELVVYDIVDDLSYFRYSNYVLKHYIERLKEYQNEGFENTINEIPISINISRELNL